MTAEHWADTIANMVLDPATSQFRFRVLGHSMTPTLRPGDEVLVERTDPASLAPGDVILVRHGGHLILHRLLDIQGRGTRQLLLTGGDHLRRADPPVPVGALVGRAVSAHRGDRPLALPAGRWQARLHRLRFLCWLLVGRLRRRLPRGRCSAVAVLPLLLASALAAGPVWASVTLVSFDAVWQGDAVQNHLGDSQRDRPSGLLRPTQCRRDRRLWKGERLDPCRGRSRRRLLRVDRQRRDTRQCLLLPAGGRLRQRRQHRLGHRLAGAGPNSAHPYTHAHSFLDSHGDAQRHAHADHESERHTDTNRES